MCNAFSCIVTHKKKTIWKFAGDSHDDLLKSAKIEDDSKDPKTITFCRVEISPKNKNYLEPDEWIFKIDMDITPTWWTLDHKKACEKAHGEWMQLLYKILVRKTIVHPFKITPPKKITKKHIALLKEWDSVGHMALVAALEGAFDIMLDTDDILGLSSVARAREILMRYGVVFDAA